MSSSSSFVIQKSENRKIEQVLPGGGRYEGEE
jgi:hypothetical protein